MPASYLVDTNVLVDSLRQNSRAQEYLDSLKSWGYSVISAMEIFAGARDKKEINALEEFFAAYREVPGDPMDVLIAATAASLACRWWCIIGRNHKTKSGEWIHCVEP